MLQIELRADGSLMIDGYVNAVARDSRPVSTPRGVVVEQIEPGVFADAVHRASNVALRLDHVEKDYAGTKDGSLELKEDNIGLRAHTEIRDEKIIELAKAGRLKGWSFGAYMLEDEMEERAEKIPRRHIKKMDLFEVSLISDRMNPVYTGTSIEQRADKQFIAETRAMTDDVEFKEEKSAPEHDYSTFEERINKLTNSHEK